MFTTFTEIFPLNVQGAGVVNVQGAELLSCGNIVDFICRYWKDVQQTVLWTLLSVQCKVISCIHNFILYLPTYVYGNFSACVNAPI